MRPRDVLIYGATLLAVATLICAGYQMADSFKSGAGAMNILAPALAIATALVCIGVLDWARNLNPQAAPRPVRHRGGEPAEAAEPEDAGGEVQSELMAAVHALERLADEELSAEQATEDGLKTIAGFVDALAVTYWTMASPPASTDADAIDDDRPGGLAEAPAPPQPDGEALALSPRAHYQDGQVVFGEDAGPADAEDEPLRRAAEHQTPLLNVEEARASFVFPLVPGRSCIGVLRVVVPLSGSPQERASAAQDLSQPLARLAGLFGHTVHAPDLYDRAVVDSLTGLFTKRHFINRLNEATGASRRYGEPLALALLDIDNFKLLNSIYGHAAADRCLQAAASLVRESIREADTAYRYGGDEIAIILPGSDIDRASRAVDRLCGAMRSVRALADDGREVPVTVSVGVAEFDEDMRGIGPLMAHGEQALYAAKAAGRNRVERWREDAGANDYDELD